MEFIYQKESNLDKGNNFTIEIVTKWTDYKLKALSNLINATKKKNLSNIDLTMVVKLPNSISFGNRILKLMNEPEKVTYKVS